MIPAVMKKLKIIHDFDMLIKGRVRVQKPVQSICPGIVRRFQVRRKGPGLEKYKHKLTVGVDGRRAVSTRERRALWNQDVPLVGL